MSTSGSFSVSSVSPADREGGEVTQGFFFFFFIKVVMGQALSQTMNRQMLLAKRGIDSTTIPTVLLKFVLGKSKDTVHQSLAKNEISF